MVANPELAASPPPLPLLLWKTPPGLELILRQEGVPFETIVRPHPLMLRRGRFVLFDRRQISSTDINHALVPDQIAIDIDRLRRGWSFDPFEALIDHSSRHVSWKIGSSLVTERIARFDKGMIRRKILEHLRSTINLQGGLWARLSPFPAPYRGAFNLRLDLDEPYPEHYLKFVELAKPLNNCMTFFDSTAAHASSASVMADLRERDVQSHGHYHVVYRDPDANRRNLERAHELMVNVGIVPIGFVAPGGRWTPALDKVVESMGYRYGSEFQLGFDDLPFFPWRKDRFSNVLQLPIHPICPGLFLEAGCRDESLISDHMCQIIHERFETGEPAFIYGHPERRFVRLPGVINRLTQEIDRSGLLWRTTLTEFAHWWHWRNRQRWSVMTTTDHRFEIQFEDWNPLFPMTVEVVRGSFVARMPIRSPRQPLEANSLVFQRLQRRADLPEAYAIRRPWSMTETFRSILDWETVTPVDDLPAGSMTDRVKRRLRRWKERASTHRGKQS